MAGLVEGRNIRRGNVASDAETAVEWSVICIVWTVNFLVGLTKVLLQFVVIDDFCSAVVPVSYTHLDVYKRQG